MGTQGDKGGMRGGEYSAPPAVSTGVARKSRWVELNAGSLHGGMYNSVATGSTHDLVAVVKGKNECTCSLPSRGSGSGPCSTRKKSALQNSGGSASEGRTTIKSPLQRQLHAWKCEILNPVGCQKKRGCGSSGGASCKLEYQGVIRPAVRRITVIGALNNDRPRSTPDCKELLRWDQRCGS